MKLPDITREDIIRQAEYLKKISQHIIDLYSKEDDDTCKEAHARIICSSGSLSQDVTVLSVYITAYEYKNN